LSAPSFPYFSHLRPFPRSRSSTLPSCFLRVFLETGLRPVPLRFAMLSLGRALFASFSSRPVLLGRAARLILYGCLPAGFSTFALSLPSRAYHPGEITADRRGSIGRDFSPLLYRSARPVFFAPCRVDSGFLSVSPLLGSFRSAARTETRSRIAPGIL